MASIPFNLYVKRLYGKEPEPVLLDLLSYIPGEAKVRELGASRQGNRVRSICRMIMGKLKACDRAVGKELRVETGEVCRTHCGKGRVLWYGTVRKATLVIVRDEKGALSFAYEVDLLLGMAREASGAFRKRKAMTLVIDSLPVRKVR